jgi:hypothetical protein
MNNAVLTSIQSAELPLPFFRKYACTVVVNLYNLTERLTLSNFHVCDIESPSAPRSFAGSNWIRNVDLNSFNNPMIVSSEEIVFREELKKMKEWKKILLKDKYEKKNNEENEKEEEQEENDIVMV